MHKRSFGALISDDFFHKAAILGKPLLDWQAIDLAEIKASVKLNGKEVETGSGAEILGHPFQAVAWLANKFTSANLTLRAGDIVMTGSMAPAHWLTQYPSNVVIEIEQVGRCSIDLDAKS